MATVETPFETQTTGAALVEAQWSVEQAIEDLMDEDNDDCRRTIFQELNQLEDLKAELMTVQADGSEPVVTVRLSRWQREVLEAHTGLSL